MRAHNTKQNQRIAGMAVLHALVLVVLICAVVGGTASAADADIYVNQTGWWHVDGVFHANDTPIRAAVDAASAGDTIVVRDGIYTENVNVCERLTIRSENGSASTVVWAADPDGHVFEVTADYVNISGFTVTGATESRNAGILLICANHCNISENNASDNWYGIWLDKSNNNTLTSNTANSNGDHGISMSWSSNNTLMSNTANSNNNGFGIQLSSDSSNNNLTSNTANSNVLGIKLRSSSNNNTVANNTANSNNGFGIQLECSSDNVLTGNTVSDNGDGISLESSSNNTITGNTLLSNNHNGFWMENSTSNTINGNIASNNNHNGICIVDNCTYNNITSNIAFNNSRVGIWLKFSSQNTLTGNNLSNNGNTNIYYYKHNSLKDYDNIIDTTNHVNGLPVYFYFNQSDLVLDNLNTKHIAIVGCTNVTIRNNNVSNGDTLRLAFTNNSLVENNIASNNYYGIFLRSGNNDTIRDNTLNSNNINGIAIWNSQNNTISNNIASNNSYGILLSGSSNNTFTNNTVNSNSASGIYLEDNIASNNSYGIRLSGSSNNTFTNNTVNSNSASGIHLEGSSNYNTILNNIARENNPCGINLYESSNNVITCNLVQDNMQNGFYLTGGSINNNISYNNIIGNGNYNNTTGGYEWQFENDQSDCVDAINNWWGTNDETNISASIYDWNDNSERGNVTYLPRLGQPAPCAPPPKEPPAPAFTTADAVIALEIAAGSRPYDSRWDVSGDNRVTSLDALMILQAN